MRRKRGSIIGRLAGKETRARVHAAILLIVAGALLAVIPGWDIFSGMPRTVDGIQHYRGGQAAAGFIFYLAYLGIILRVLLVGRGRSSMTRMLLWIPALVAAGMAAAVAVSILISLGKEVLDWGGMGSPERIDLEAGLAGALSVVPAAAIIMALTPFLIPLDILLQIPRLMLFDLRSGLKTVDRYLREQRSHSRLGGPSEVLVVEDDIHCAATVMSYFRGLELRCRHVSTIADADRYLRAHLKTIRLVTLDIFVRVDSRGNNRTGGEWLAEISREFPPGRRSFLVVVISGHTDYLEPNGGGADLVLRKPWLPAELTEFLRSRGVIGGQWKKS